MKIRIIQQGWETFTGDLGTVEFVNGENVDSISPREALALGSYVNVVEIDGDGKVLGQVNAAHDMVKLSSIAAPTPRVMRTLKEIQEEAEAAATVKAAAPVKGTPYTRLELEAIATDKGIGGLREVSDPLKIKGTSIKLLIEEILLKQPQTTPVEA